MTDLNWNHHLCRHMILHLHLYHLFLKLCLLIHLVCFLLLGFQLSYLHVILSDDEISDLLAVNLKIYSKSQLMEFRVFQDFRLIFPHAPTPKILLSFFCL